MPFLRLSGPETGDSSVFPRGDLRPQVCPLDPVRVREKPN